MIIEITGARFLNRGAQLMLAETCNRLRTLDDTIIVSIPMGNDRFVDRAKYRLHYTLRPPSIHSAKRLLRDMLLNAIGNTSLANSYGFVKPIDIDAIIDISGYGYGDKWPVSNTLKMVRAAKACKNRGKPIVMLPQMLGPFTDPTKATAFSQLAGLVDLIYARDSVSHMHAKPLVPNDGRLRTAPDITIAVTPPLVTLPEARYACIIPNSKLLESTSQRANWARTYIDTLAKAARHLHKCGLRLYLVRHSETLDDCKLVDDVLRRLTPIECATYATSDPSELKAFLSGAELVLGSRFHGLVGALSMGVPVIALGWAHKYEALLEEFGTPRHILVPHDEDRRLYDIIDDTLRDRAALSSLINSRKQLMVSSIESMWTHVYEALNLRTRTTDATRSMCAT